MGIMNILGKNNNRGGNIVAKLSSNAMNNLVIFISFGVMIYILVQMIIVLNKPEFLYYTLSPMPTDLSTTKFSNLKNSNKIPNTFAREFTYSFWVYLRSINKIRDDKYKLLFLRSEAENDNYFLKANPIVYFDKNSNKLIVKIRTTDADNTTLTSVLPNNNITDNFHNDKCIYSTLTVDYIPLKRWVNIIINVDNNRVTLFVDGDIYQTELVNRLPDECSDVNVSNSRLVSETAGNIKLGENDMDDIHTPDGLISKLQFFNYSLKTPSDIRKIYDNGPVESQSFLQKFGIPNLGVRNPIYNIEDTCN
jgi:hypothetical protein